MKLESRVPSETAPADRPQEILPLTGIRGVAAMLVLYGHFWTVWYQGFPLEPWLPQILSHIGVDLFFVLSGFVIALVHAHDFTGEAPARALPRFLLLRLVRIYPLHLFTLVLALGFAVLAYGLGVDLSDDPRFDSGLLIANLLLVQAWGWAPNDSWNIVAWSISAEWFAYLLFPFLAMALFKVRRAGAALAIAVLCVVLFNAAFFLAVENLDTRRTYDLGLVRLFFGFLAGAALHRAYALGILQRPIPWGRIGDLSAAALALIVALAPASWAGLSLLPITLLILALAKQEGCVSSWLRRPSIVYIGRISYSLYMMHLLVMEIALIPINFTAPRVVEPTMAAAILLGLVAVVFFASVATYRFIELPARRLGKKWIRA